jgi:hypothetical protein
MLSSTWSWNHDHENDACKVVTHGFHINILSMSYYLFKCMATNKMIILWVGLTVPIGLARPNAFSDLGRPMALEIGLEATGPGLTPRPGRPIPIPYYGTPKALFGCCQIHHNPYVLG